MKRVQTFGAVLRPVLSALAGLLAVGAATTTVGAVSRPVTVVELFTSQGCSSVPPANRNLVGLIGKGDVLPLSFSVTYWDYLGWKDTFGAESFTARQRSYEPGLGHDGPFTPQIVVNGADDTVGNKAGALRSLLTAAEPAASVPIEIKDRAVGIGGGQVSDADADVWLVRYRPGVQNVAIARGENAGTTLPIANVVTAIDRIGHWRGTPVTLSTPPAERGLRTAVLVQLPHGGRILSAATN